MAKDYTLLLKAKVDAANIDMSAIEKKIEAINKKAYKIMLQVDSMGLAEVQKKFEELIKKAQIGKSPIRIVDAEHEVAMLDQIERKIEEIKNKQGSVSKYGISTSIGKDGMDLTSATVSYTNAQKQSVAATYDWVNVAKAGEKADMAWVLTKERLTDNIKANEDAMNRAKQKASEYLEKIKSLNQSNANVIKGKGLAEQILGETDPEKIQELSRQLNVVKQSSQGARSAILSFTEGMKNSLVRTVEYSLSLGLVYGALNQLKMGIQYVKDLNKEMVNIQVATGMNKSEVDKLSLTYNNMAKELGATTLQVSSSAVTWLKQGKTVEETEKLIQASMMLSKLGLIENAEASSYLTTILNGYKFEVEDSTKIISKMVAVDNASAASISGIAEALSKTASVARDSGVEFENLIAYIATVQSVTGQTGEVVGQAFDKIEALWYNKQATIKNLL